MAASDEWLDGKNINLTLLPMEYFCVNFVWSQELKLFPAITTRNTELVILSTLFVGKNWWELLNL